MIIENRLENLRPRIFIFLQIRKCDIVTASFLPHVKGVERTLIIPRRYSTMRKSFERILGTGRYFRGNLDRDKAESTQLLGNTIPGKFLRRNSELGVTRFEGIAFERRRKYRFSKAVLRFSLGLPSCFPRSIVLYRRNDGAFILFRIGEECFVVSDGRTYVVHANGYCEKDGSFLRNYLELEWTE